MSVRHCFRRPPQLPEGFPVLLRQLRGSCPAPWRCREEGGGRGCRKQHTAQGSLNVSSLAGLVSFNSSKVQWFPLPKIRINFKRIFEPSHPWLVVKAETPATNEVENATISDGEGGEYNSTLASVVFMVGQVLLPPTYS